MFFSSILKMKKEKKCTSWTQSTRCYKCCSTRGEAVPVHVQREQNVWALGSKRSLSSHLRVLNLGLLIVLIFSDLLVLTLEGIKQWDCMDFVPGFSILHTLFPQNKDNSFQDWMEMGRRVGLHTGSSTKGLFHIPSTQYYFREKNSSSI